MLMGEEIMVGVTSPTILSWGHFVIWGKQRCFHQCNEKSPRLWTRQ